MTDSVPPGGAVLDPDELDARWAHAWRPEQVAERLAGVNAPWCVAAGWALDLFRGEQSRPHGDLEIAVPAGGFTEIRDRFPTYVFDAVGSGRIWTGAGAEALAVTHQTWLRDPESGRFFFDVFREPHDSGARARPAVQSESGSSQGPCGLPWRPPLLGRARQDRLDTWLKRVHPGHAWLEKLAGGGG